MSIHVGCWANVNRCSQLWKKIMEIPQKIKHRTTIATGNSAFGYLLKENKNTNWKKNIQVHLCSLAEKTMVPHSSTFAWKIPWTEEPGRLRSMRSLRVGHDWATSLSLFTFMQWRKKWQPTPVFLPGESQGQWSLMGCRLWGRTESDTTEAT